MSRLTINGNIASLNTQRNLTLATRRLTDSFTRLSSGMRINRASDDAAGLSVASLLNTDKAIYLQGVRNLNDGISLLNIAQDAIGEMTNILIRIGEIAEQSANGSVTAAQRKPLQDEVTALQEEYNRILHSTRFNDTQLLTGAGTFAKLQAGYGTNGGLTIQIGKALLNDALGTLSAGETKRVSLTEGGEQANGISHGGIISTDGRFLIYTSDASNIIAGVSGTQVYRRDLSTGEVALVSSSSAGNAANAAGSANAVSADGRYVTFQSSADNLVAGVTGDQLYRKDMVTGEILLVSSSSDGVQGDAVSDSSRISDDGRYISFRSVSTNIHEVAGDGLERIYRKDMVTGELELVSSNQNGAALTWFSREVSMSADGRYVSFRNGGNGNQVYVKDMDTGKLILASSNKDGVAGNASNIYSAISADGRYVAFRSEATNLVDGVGGIGAQLYRKDILTGEIELVSSLADGTMSNGFNRFPTLSADGRYVAFHATGGAFDPTIPQAVFRKDMLTGELMLVSQSSTGVISNTPQVQASISGDGSLVVFNSTSNTLVEGDTNGTNDVFLRDLSKAGVQELSGMTVSNQFLARTTLTVTRKYLDELFLARAAVGATSAQIDSALSNLSTISQNLLSASSQITDTDIADEAARLTSAQIIQQSASAVLAQANAQPEVILGLLNSSSPLGSKAPSTRRA